VKSHYTSPVPRPDIVPRSHLRANRHPMSTALARMDLHRQRARGGLRLARICISARRGDRSSSGIPGPKRLAPRPPPLMVSLSTIEPIRLNAKSVSEPFILSPRSRKFSISPSSLPNSTRPARRAVRSNLRSLISLGKKIKCSDTDFFSENDARPSSHHEIYRHAMSLPILFQLALILFRLDTPSSARQESATGNPEMVA